METITEITAEFLARYDGATLYQYTLVLSAWRQWCNDNSINMLQATQAHIEVYATYLQKTGKRRTTSYNYIAVVCLYYQYLTDRGVIACNPAAHARRPRLYRRSQGTYLTQAQAQAFLAEAATRSATENALCHVLLLSGARASETIGLKIADYHHAGDADWVTFKRKYSWMQNVRIAPKAATALQACIGSRTSGYIFRVHGKQMKNYQAIKIVRSIAQTIGVDNITPHSLRRTFCTLSRDAGIPDREIMISGGWAKENMLNYYDVGAIAQKSTASLRLEQFITQ